MYPFEIVSPALDGVEPWRRAWRRTPTRHNDPRSMDENAIIGRIYVQATITYFHDRVHRHVSSALTNVSCTARKEFEGFSLLAEAEERGHRRKPEELARQIRAIQVYCPRSQFELAGLYFARVTGSVSLSTKTIVSFFNGQPA